MLESSAPECHEASIFPSPERPRHKWVPPVACYQLELLHLDNSIARAHLSHRSVLACTRLSCLRLAREWIASQRCVDQLVLAIHHPERDTRPGRRARSHAISGLEIRREGGDGSGFCWLFVTRGQAAAFDESELSIEEAIHHRGSASQCIVAHPARCARPPRRRLRQ
jgi:hypothetical protein